MTIPETGFIANVNIVANNIDVVAQAADLFTESSVAILQEIATLDLAEITEDLKKGNYKGNRKLDINLALNNSSITTHVAYKQANILLKDGMYLTIPFVYQQLDLTWAILELTSHADIKEYITTSVPYTTYVTDTEATVEDAIGTNPQVIRFRDSDGKASNIDRIDLIAYSGNYIESQPDYFWAETTSSLEILANRAADIITLGANIDEIITLSNMTAEITAIAAKETELTAVYSSIIPALPEILLADDSAAAALASKDTAVLSATNAGISAAASEVSANTAAALANQIIGLTTVANTVTVGNPSTASYNSNTGVLTLGIPVGATGAKGDPFVVNATGTSANRSAYDTQIQGFSYLATDTSLIYFKASSTPGAWSAGAAFGKGDTGAQGVQGFSWLSGAGVPSAGLGVNGDIYFNQTNADVYTKSGGSWGSPTSNLAAGINDAITSVSYSWSSSKISTQLALKVNNTQVLTNVPAGALFTDTVYTHPTADGSMHVPPTSNTNNGKVLTAGATPGSMSWVAPTVGTVISVGATAPLVSSGGASPVLSITAATISAPGVMTAADKIKLDGIAAGADVNVGTSLNEGTRTTTTVPVLSSTGVSAVLSAATALLAGVMSAADKAKLDNSVVDITTAQTIAGVKTFSSNPISTAAQAVAIDALTRKDYVDGISANIQSQLNGKASVGANGDITSLTALTNITAAPVTLSTDDKVLIKDTSDSDKLKTVLVSALMPSGSIAASGYTQNTNKLLGRTTASTGAIEEITVGSGLTLSAGNLSASSTGITLGTPVASTSGTAIDFGSLPAGIKQLTVSVNGVSFSGSNELSFRLGDSGTPKTTGYISSGAAISSTANTTAGYVATTGFACVAGTSSVAYAGSITFTLENSSTNTWVAQGQFAGTSSAASAFNMVSGRVSLSGALDIVRIYGGTFDAGEINIAYI